MSDTFLNVVTEQLLNKLLSLAAEETRLAWGFKSELKNLSKRLERTQALLCDAQKRPVTEKYVQGWLTDLRTVAYDADDVLDEFAYKVLRGKLQVENQLRSKVSNFFSPSNPLIFRLNMAHKVKNINIKFNDIYKEANDIGLKPVELINVVVERRETRQSHPYVDDSKVVGRDGDVSTVLDMLLGSNDADDDDLPVIAVVGMGGVGKTTLAQLVYNDEKVVSNFGERMWVCVSTDFNVKKLLNEMLESVTRTKDEMSNAEAMIKKLRDNLNGKRYLLVLDDVWNEDPGSWENMRNSLLGIGGANGSKIVVTTRSRVVASTVQIPLSHTHLLDPLSENDSWIIFEKRAFADGGPIQTSSLVDVGKRLIGRCRGLPLAIKALGALMYSKKNENEWISIERSETWSNTDVLPTLRLSFDHLPSLSLKQCFAYCSLYPKDFVFEKNFLIELWMAQGYLEPPEGSSLEMEDKGNNYFDSLLWNSLLEVVEKDEYDNVISCNMHDLVHDLAVNIAKDSCLTMETGKEYDNSKVQHLSLVFETGRVPELSRVSCHKLRTLVCMGDFLGDLLREFTCLHVLDLTKCKIEELPKSIGKLIHLRLLVISDNPIKKLPNSICELYHLQTFRILNCLLLEALPKEFKNLVSLRHFYMDDDEKHRKLMPKGMAKLTCLQTLPFFVVGQDKGRGIEELGRLRNLRRVLKIYNLEHVKSKVEAEKANLSTNSNIHELKLHWCGEREADTNRDENVLEGLKPHRNLKGLTIENFYGGKLASWMFTTSDTSLLYGLVKLNLKNCKTLEHIPTLGHLPRLKILSIEGMHNVKHIGSEFYELDGEIREMTTGAATITIFPVLRELSLVDMPNLLEWSEADCLRSGVRVVFPCLEKLRISGCSNLISAPADFPSIKELVIEEVNSVALEKMSNSMSSLTSLTLSKSSGHEIDFVLSNLLKNNRSIKKLVIQNCEELSRLPKELWGVASLEELEICDCPNLMSVPDIIIEEETGGGSFIYRLRGLVIVDCNKLSCLPKGLRNLTSLEKLHIVGCGNLTGINPSDMRCLKSVGWVVIVNCGMLKTSGCWPEWLFSLTNLKTLCIGGFSEELDYFPWPSSSSSSSSTPDSQPLPLDHQLPLLKDLALWGWPNLKSLPDQLQQLTPLVNFTIISFNGLEALPDWLGNLSSLQTLRLINCKNLMHLPSVEFMRRLTYLEIDDCPLLAERCKRGSGREWKKIAHIPSIHMYE